MSTKDELEIQKLEAEIRHLHARLAAEERSEDLEHKRSSREGLKVWAGTAVAALTLGTGILGIYTTLEQRQKRYDHEVNQTMIQLVQQLSSREAQERTNAALLLSSFELDAVPLLLANLDDAEDPTAIITALRLIADKRKVDKKAVMKALQESAEEALANRYRDEPTDDRDVQLFKNYFTALGQLGDLQPAETVRFLEGFKEEFDRVEPRPVEFDERLVRGWINKACEEINDEACLES